MQKTKIMKFKSDLIEQLRNGQIAVTNNDLHDDIVLIKIMKQAFPTDIISSGRATLYYASTYNRWTSCSKAYDLPKGMKLLYAENFIEKEFPEKYAVKFTQAVQNHIVHVIGMDLYKHDSQDSYFHYPNFGDYNGYRLGHHTDNSVKTKYTEITEQEYIDNVINKEPMKKGRIFPFLLTQKQAKDMVNIACSAWSVKLMNLWVKEFFTDKPIYMSEDLYKHARKEATHSQHTLLDEIFGKDKPEKVYPPKGTVLYVKFSENSIEWCMRYFSHYDNRGFYCFDAQKKSGSSVIWYVASTTNPLTEGETLL